MIEAGDLGLRIVPIATGFWKETDAKLRSQRAAKAEVKVAANIREASREIAMFRMREQANAVNLRVKIDERSIRTANDKIKYIEHTWKQSDIKRAIRIQVFVAGAAALPSITQGIVSLTAAMTELSRAAVALPGLLAGVGASVATLLTGVNGVGQAFKAFGQGMQKSEQYARQYAQASRALENAQRDVVKALRDANREIEDQKDKLARGQLSVEQAQLNVRRANERMFQGGFQSITDYQQALLDIRTANLDLADAIKQNGRTIQDYYAEAAKGATETNTYKDAVDRLASSVDAFHKAQFEALGMSEQFISAMKMLAPAGQDFVLEVLKLKGAWLGLQSSVQTTLFKGLGAEITDLANKQLPMLKTGMQQVAEAINNDFKVLFQSLGRQANTDNISNIFKNTGIALKAATPGIDSFTSGLLKLSEVGTRFLPRMALAFDRVMAKFEAFINKADKDGSLNKWIDSGLKVISSLGRSLLDIGSILGSITKAYNAATGNVGGLASTMERGLSKFAKTMASPEGQGRLISWMRTSREFMKTIGDALPGIAKIFGAIGDGARQFATWAFPIFSRLGILVGDNSQGVKGLVAAFITFRTVKPILSETLKLIHSINAQLAKYTEKKANFISSRNAAWKEMFDAEGLRFAAGNQLKEMRREMQELDSRNQNGIIAQTRREREVALQELAQAKKDAAAAKKDARAAQKSASSDIIVPGVSKDEQGKFAKQQAKLYEEAKQKQIAAAANFDRWDRSYNDALIYRTKRRMELESQMPLAWKNYRQSISLAEQANKNFLETSRLTASGLSGVWARTTTSIKGKLAELRGAMTAVVGTITGVGVAIGVTAGLDLLTAAQDRAKASADNLKESQEALAQTLSKSTGSATAATIEENTRQLRDRANPVHPDDRGQRFDAINILQSQLGISPAEAAALALPTEIKKREARLAPGDTAIIAAVPGLQEWKDWGSKYQENGVTAAVYGKALNGDPESIGKVEAARQAIKNTTVPRAYMGAAVAMGLAPNDLGHAQEQLDRTGPNGGLRGLSLAVGAERSVGNEALAKGSQEYQNAQMVPQKGLNAFGMRVFGPFVLGAHGALLRPDYSGTIEVDKYPDDVVPGWVQGAADKGISVERRYPTGAIITIDPEHSLKYFNGFAAGGPVWGAGTATSDSIPAMLSNGEYVINAKSAAAIGHDTLNRMNSLKFASGGPVKKFAPGGPVDGNQFTDQDGNIWSQTWGWIRDRLFPEQPDPGPQPTVGLPYRGGVDSSPVETPLPPAPTSPPGKGIGANIGGGNLYIPDLSGSGALKDSISYPGFVGTDASRAANAPINPNANILDYLVQVANAAGLRPGSGPASNAPGDAGAQKAARLGIAVHDNDGAQHSVDRALDIGSFEQAKSGEITKFVKAWMADPQKVASTRQLIFKDPTTGEVFGIHHGVALYGQDALNVYGNDFDGHKDHVHLALEGVPLEAFSQTGAGAVDVPNSISAPPSAPAVPAGPAASVSGPTAIAPPGATPPAGPANNIPALDPFYFLRQIGAAILKGILGFFGIDGSSFVDALFALGDNKPAGPQVDQIPEPDQALIANLDAEIAKYEAIGTPSAKQMAEQLKKGKEDYLKQFQGPQAAKSANAAADYFDSIGQKDLANNLRANANVVADPKNPERFGPVTTVPGTGGAPTVLPRPGSGNGLTAPPAAYSGGTPEVHNAVYRAFKEAGFDDSEWPSLVQLLNHENDTWDPTRPTGGPNSDARGIFQFLSTTWGSVGMTPSDDPYMQAVAGMKYIKGKYGTPTGAWTFWQNPTSPPFGQNWYRLGGLVRRLKGGGWAKKPKLPGEPVDPGDFLAQFEEANYGPLTLMGRPGGMPYLVDPMDNAAGGYISGPGGPTDDKIPAMLSNGEFVMRAAAVKHWGVDRLHAMNKYANGGLVGYAPGGLVGDQSSADKELQKQMLLSAFNPNAPQAYPTMGDAWKNQMSDRLAAYYPQQATTSAPTMGVPGAGPIIPNTSTTKSLGLGPTPNVVSNGYRNAVNSIGQGVSNSVEGMATGLFNMVAHPVDTAKALAPLVGLGGADAPGVGESWKGLGKGLLHWDEWKDDPFAAGAGLFTDIAGGFIPAGKVAGSVGKVAIGEKATARLSEIAASAKGAAGRAAGAFSSPATFLDSLRLTAERRAALEGLPMNLDKLGPIQRRQVQTAIADLKTAYPSVPLSGVRAYSPKEVVKNFGGRTLGAEAFANSATMEIGINAAAQGLISKLLTGGFGSGILSGFTNGSLRRGNMFALMAHEFGHIADYSTGASLSQAEIGAALLSGYAKGRKGFTNANGELTFGGAQQGYKSKDFAKYVRGALSKYSYKQNTSIPGLPFRERVKKTTGYAGSDAIGSIDRYESIAEAFSDVTMNGPKARQGSRLIYDELMKKMGIDTSIPKSIDQNLISGRAAADGRRAAYVGADAEWWSDYIHMTAKPLRKAGWAIQDALSSIRINRGLSNKTIAELTKDIKFDFDPFSGDPQMEGLFRPGRRTEREIRQSIARLRATYPSAPLTEVRLGKIDEYRPGGEMGNALASAHPNTRVIELNPTLFMDPRKLNARYRKAENVGWLPRRGRHSAIQAVLAHEYGHILDFHFGNNLYPWDIEEMLRNDFQGLRPDLSGFSGDASHDAPNHFINFIRSYFPNRYSYTDGGTREQFKRTTQAMWDIANGATGLAGNKFVAGPDDAVSLALKSIDRDELLANSFADVFLRGSKAAPGSKAVYSMMRAVSDDFDRLDFKGTGKSTMLPKMSPYNSKGNTKVFGMRTAPDERGMGPKPRNGMTGGALGLTWEKFAERAKNIWKYPIEDKRGQIDQFFADVDEAGMFPKSPPGSPFNYDELTTLLDYSGSSSVNKTMRGMDNLVGRKNLLDELLGIRKNISGPGGELRAVRGIVGPGKVSAQRQSVTAQLAEDVLSLREFGSKKSLEEIINLVAGQSGKSFVGGATPQQVWEATLIEALASAKRAAGRAKGNLAQISALDSSFGKARPLPEDMWVTRMIEDFGDGPVDDPESLIEKLITNPGYTSTAGGITSVPQRSRDWWKGVFGERPIMQQIRVPKGTPGIWFGGSENELLLPRNMGFVPEDWRSFQEMLGPEGGRHYDEVSRILEGKTGQKVKPQYKIWGDATFPSDISAIPDIGFSQIDALLRDLSKVGPGGMPAWMRLLQPPGPGTSPYTAFRIPAHHNLGYAAGGSVSGPGGPTDDRIPAMLSNGEFVMNAAATKHWGIDRLNAMNAIRRYAPGGPVLKDPVPPPPPTGSSDPQAYADLSAPPPPQSGSSDPDAYKDLDKAIADGTAGTVQTPGVGLLKGLGATGPKLGGGGGGAAVKAADPRATIQAAPTSDTHINPALAGGIKGAFNTIGSIAGTAAQLAMASGTMGASLAAPGAGSAASSIIQAGTQFAGDVAVGAANVLSSLLVGTVTPSQTGQGYGAPLLPQPPQQPAMNNFQSIHNGNIVTNNLSEYSRLKDRKDAQKAAPFFNRVGK